MWCQKLAGFKPKCQTLLPFDKSCPPTYLDESMQKGSLVSRTHHEEETDGRAYQTGVLDPLPTHNFILAFFVVSILHKFFFSVYIIFSPYNFFPHIILSPLFFFLSLQLYFMLLAPNFSGIRMPSFYSSARTISPPK